MNAVIPPSSKKPVEALRELAAEGKTYDEIGAELGLSYSKVYGMARDNGVAVARKTKVDRKGVSEIEKLASEGVAPKGIAEALGLNLSSVYSAMKRNGIKVAKAEKPSKPISARSVRLAEVKRLYGEGNASEDIVHVLGVSRTLVLGDYKALGISVSDEKYAQKKAHSEQVRVLAEEGMVAGEIAEKLNLRPDAVKVIAREFEISIPRVKPVDHGTLLSYQRGCKCGKCRAANTEEGRRQRESRKSRETPEEIHGTFNGYQNWDCHCERCKAAGELYNRLKLTLDVPSERKNARWTPEEDLIVADYNLTARELAIKLNRTITAVNLRRSLLSR
jgi:DNA-binding CsgD family transcriptional regulator